MPFLVCSVVINPQFFNIDLKMIAEARLSWVLLYALVLSSAIKQHENWDVPFSILDIENHTVMGVSYSMFCLNVSIWLYANACCKGEQFIVTTWDIYIGERAAMKIITYLGIWHYVYPWSPAAYL